MDDRFYLAVYDKGVWMEEVSFLEEDYVCEVVLPGYELCEAGGRPAIRKARFTEIAASLYRIHEAQLPKLDALTDNRTARHQAMAADEERLYNVYVYVAEEV